MGITRWGPPEEIIVELKNLYNIQRFVETGTYYGKTARWASRHFRTITTIECSEILHKEATRRHGHIGNIEFLLGDTRHWLKEVICGLDGPAVFWLDAHWGGGETFGENDECPAMEEIKILNRSEKENFIFIDDARLFLSPPPPHHNLECWPDVSTVIGALNSGKNKRYIVIVDDVIIAVPYFARQAVQRYCQRANEAKRYLKSRQCEVVNIISSALKDKIKGIFTKR